VVAVVGTPVDATGVLAAVEVAVVTGTPVDAIGVLAVDEVAVVTGIDGHDPAGARSSRILNVAAADADAGKLTVK
jgi:hypothetical protein